jgi:hypothetical protein
MEFKVFYALFLALVLAVVLLNPSARHDKPVPLYLLVLTAIVAVHVL